MVVCWWLAGSFFLFALDLDITLAEGGKLCLYRGVSVMVKSGLTLCLFSFKEIFYVSYVAITDLVWRSQLYRLPLGGRSATPDYY